MKNQTNYWVSSIDPLKEWRVGPIGWLGRIRGIAAFVLLDLGIAGLILRYLSWQLALGALVAGFALATLFWILGRQRLRFLRLGVKFHDLCHWVRDASANLQNYVENDQAVEYVEGYKRFHDDVAERIASLFRTMISDDGICCVIRLADKSAGDPVYATRGRSQGLDLRRSDRTVPIPIDRGIARKLMDENQLGVTFINDIELAVKENWWVKSENDDLPDIRHLMISPINCCERNSKSMLGILYVTSRRPNLTLFHAEPMKAIADLLGHVYPTITVRFEEGGSEHDEK